jgi:hypothetical protein
MKLIDPNFSFPCDNDYTYLSLHAVDFKQAAADEKMFIKLRE